MTYESLQQIDYTLMGSSQMSSAEAFPARTSASPDEASGSTVSAAGCGPSSPGSLASYDPDTHSLKTWQLSLAEDWSGSSVTLPRSGSMRNGELFPQPTWARPTGGSGSGLWPTPQAHDAAIGNASRVGRYGTEHGGRNLNDWVAMWPTPTATLGTSQTAPWKPGVQWWLQSRAARHLEALVQHPERMWQTPVADDAMDRVAGKLNSRGEPKLSTQVKLWPTPTTVSNQMCPSMRDRGSACRNLSDAGVTHGALNPTWVEWLMGFSKDWTKLE